MFTFRSRCCAWHGPFSPWFSGRSLLMTGGCPSGGRRRSWRAALCIASFLFVLASTSGHAALTAPADGATLASDTMSVAWTTDPSDTDYLLSIGTAAAGSDLYYGSHAGQAGMSISGLPTDGALLYVTLETVTAVSNVTDSVTVTAHTSDAGGVDASSAAFLDAVDELFVRFDPEMFGYIVGANWIGLAVGMGGGWMIRAIRAGS